jgi:AcrR family transcriptional regulator
MVEGAAYLMRRRGLNATSLRDVVAHSEASRGSISHHFPQGKQQLLEEAVRHAGQEVDVPLRRLMAEKGAVEGMRRFLLGWQRMVEESGYEAGCAVLVAAIEAHPGNERHASGSTSDLDTTRLLDIAHEMFRSWEQTVADSLIKEGVKRARARQLAVLMITAVEGSIALCRAARSSVPLQQVGDVVIELFAAAVTAGGRTDTGSKQRRPRVRP